MNERTNRRDPQVPFARQCHPACIACRNEASGGLGVWFEREDDGGVAAHFDCDKKYQGYPDRLHGGVVAMLLDAAMTHCLFAREAAGVTARLSVRYDHPARVGVPAVVRARIVRVHRLLFKIEATLEQLGQVRARAEASFIVALRIGLDARR